MTQRGPWVRFGCWPVTHLALTQRLSATLCGPPKDIHYSVNEIVLPGS
jgi:hypothetical protein